MKILHLLYSGLGGHGNVFFSMAAADEYDEFEYQALFKGIEPVRAEYVKQCDEKNIKWEFLLKKRGFDLRYYLRLYKAIKRSGAEIIFLHGGDGLLPARFARMFSPVIKKILVRETQANHLKSKGDWIRLSLSMLFASKVIFLTDAYNKQIAKKLWWLYREKKIEIIPNGINLDMYRPVPKTGGDKLILGMQSRIVRIKDHQTLLTAFANLLKNERSATGLQLNIAGDGECKNELMEMAKTLQIDKHVWFTGELNETELVTFLNNLDIYIHASFGETMSTAIMQAMACKKPVVASDVPGINNMLKQNETGMLVPVKDPESMSRVIQDLINNRDMRNSLADNAFTFAKENYSNLVMFNRYKQIFKS